MKPFSGLFSLSRIKKKKTHLTFLRGRDINRNKSDNMYCIAHVTASASPVK